MQVFPDLQRRARGGLFVSAFVCAADTHHRALLLKKTKKLRMGKNFKKMNEDACLCVRV